MVNISFFTMFIACMASFSMLPVAKAACSSCLVSSVVGAAGAGVGVSSSAMNPASRIPIGNHHRSALLYLTMSRMSTHFGTSINHRSYQESDKDKNQEEQNAKEEFDEIMNSNKDKADKSPASAKKPVSAAMVGTIGFYKNFISPLLPPACRFLPTCSQYGVQAIEDFGPEKGVILTAWRLLRCSPFGGKGYDPPKWPPVAYNYGSY